MNALKLALLSGLISTMAMAADPWTTTDTVLEGVSELGLAGEWAQMLTPTRWVVHTCEGDKHYGAPICGIDAKILSHYPNRRSTNLYFGSWMLGHPILSYLAPKPGREGFQWATIGFEIAVNRHNASIGCVLHF